LKLLALHLASAVVEGGVWVCLSYHGDRFPFLTHDSGGGDELKENRMPQQGGALDMRKYWSVRKKEEVEAPSGQDRAGVHAPTVVHSLYVLERTGEPT
jgi:hypothetical protein